MINLITALPFYDNRSEQNQFKENSFSLSLYRHYCDQANMHNWQISVPLSVTGIDAIQLYGLSNIYNLYPDVNPAFQIVTDGVKKWIIYEGGQLIFKKADGSTEDLIINPGFYEWRVTAGGKTYYSEVFCLPREDSICDSDWKLKIEAWNTQNWNGYYFNNDFKFVIYFDAFITNILAGIADTTVKDGFDRPEVIQRVITPTYVINFDPMPNILAFFMGVLTAMKNIIITERATGNQYFVKNIRYQQEPIEGTSLDLVTYQFTLFDADYIGQQCDK